MISTINADDRRSSTESKLQIQARSEEGGRKLTEEEVQKIVNLVETGIEKPEASL
jgi:hypothetical protein